MSMIVETTHRPMHSNRAEQFIGAVQRAPVSNGLGFTVSTVWKPEEAARFSAEEARLIASDLNAYHTRTGLGREWVDCEYCQPKERDKRRARP